MILNILAKYTKQIDEYVTGTFVRDVADQYKGGSRINYIFYEIFVAKMNDIDPFDALSDLEILTAIRNAAGLSPGLFIPESAFENLSR